MTEGLSTSRIIHADRFDPTLQAFGQLSLGAVFGPLIFTFGWMALGWLRPGFNSVIDPVSGLGVGDHAIWMNASFVVCGVATLIGVIGTFGVFAAVEGRWHRIGTVLLGLSGIGVVADGLFTYKSFLPHFLGFVIAIGAPIIGFPLAGRRVRAIDQESKLGSWLFIAGPVLLGLLVIFFRTFDPSRVNAGLGIAGLTERVLILALHVTIAALGWYAYKTSTNLCGSPAIHHYSLD